MAVPGSVVGVGKLITPGGQQGPKGDAGTAANVPLADITQDGLLRKTSGNTTDFVDGTNNYQPLAPVIWNQRLRSFSSVGNCSFECDQRQCGTVTTNPAGSFIQDRWSMYKGGTMTITAQQVDAGKSVGGGVVLPGTSYVISNAFLRITLTGQQASLGSGDEIDLSQSIEGSCFRELIGDVHSLSILVRSTVASLKFGVTLKDPGNAKSLTKLCTLSATANTWTLIQLANLLAWPSGGNFSSAPGVQGYTLLINLAGGSAHVTPANDVWQNGNFYTAVGQDNFASKAVNSTVDFAFVQHEPGSVCSTLQDKPFFQNYTECQRYFIKSYPYGTKPGTASITAGMYMMPVMQQSLGTLGGTVYFPVRMAKAPTLSFWSYDGSANAVSPPFSATNFGISGVQCVGDGSFSGVTMSTTAGPAGQVWQGHYIADSGW